VKESKRPAIPSPHEHKCGVYVRSTHRIHCMFECACFQKEIQNHGVTNARSYARSFHERSLTMLPTNAERHESPRSRLINDAISLYIYENMSREREVELRSHHILCISIRAGFQEKLRNDGTIGFCGVNERCVAVLPERTKTQLDSYQGMKGRRACNR